MIIRKATAEDLPAVLELLKEFQEESLKEYGANINAELLRESCENYVATTFIAEQDGKVIGVLAGTVKKVPTFSKPIYHEEVWYVTKAHRLRAGIHLLKTLEEWCEVNGIGAIIMVHMYNSKADELDTFYRKSGYSPFEVDYVKLIKGGR